MSFARSTTRIARGVKQAVFRRNMAGGGHSENIPGLSVTKEILTGCTLGLLAGLVWKNWQWNDKAKRVENNLAWDRYYDKWAADSKAASMIPEGLGAPYLAEGETAESESLEVDAEVPTLANKADH